MNINCVTDIVLESEITKLVIRLKFWRFVRPVNLTNKQKSNVYIQVNVFERNIKTVQMLLTL